MISSGDLNKRVNIERRTAGYDDLGQPVDTWEIVAAVWGSIRYPSGVAAIKSGADVSIVKASIRIRYKAGLDAGMRASADGQVFNVVAVLPNRSQGYVDLVCERVQ